ncbi:MAG: FixH family protein [Bacteroidota bacterium]
MDGSASAITVARRRAAVLAVTTLCALAGCGGGGAEPPGFEPGVPPETAPLASVASAAGTWEVSLWTAPQPPRKGTVMVKYRIVDANGAPGDGLRVEVVPWMPAHGHGTPVVPTVTPEGDGWYLVKRVSLYMSGHWELRTAMAGAVNDTVVPVVDVP